MDSKQLVPLRQELLNTMDVIHKLCLSHPEFTYYIGGGTALGAARHKGFIPWDTDIDIVMPRKSYDCFISFLEKKPIDNYKIISYKSKEDYYHPHALFVNLKTMIHWNTKYYAEGKQDVPVYIDIFPLDEVPEGESEQKKHAKQIERMKKLQSRRNCIIYQHNSSFERFLKKCYAGILKSVQNNRRFNEKFDLLLQKYSDGTHDIWCSMTGRHTYQKESMSKSIYGKPVLYEFEDREFYGPEQIDAYLKKYYGDYMKLPPEEERTEYMDNIEYIDFNICD
ncbi:MAG: LicD family protein [Clostridia bacterium]|nr:LicD family protein [Clostridia bacterium]